MASNGVALPHVWSKKAGVSCCFGTWHDMLLGTHVFARPQPGRSALNPVCGVAPQPPTFSFASIRMDDGLTILKLLHAGAVTASFPNQLLVRHASPK